MKIRLAKKHRLGKFQEEGCLLHTRFNPPLAEPSETADALITKIEEMNLTCSGSLTHTGYQLFITHEAPYQKISQETKTALRAFCLTLPNCVETATSANFDSNHAREKTWQKIEDPSHPGWTREKPQHEIAAHP